MVRRFARLGSAPLFALCSKTGAAPCAKPGAALCAAITLAAALSAPHEAHAQALREPGKVAISIERAFGINYSHTEIDKPLHAERSDTTLGFGFQPGLSPLHWARFGVDVFINEHWSVGGSVGFFKVSGDTDASGLLLAPRVGYALPLGKLVTFWPRAGFSYVKPGDAHLIGLSLEGMFVISANPAWGVLVGPTLDVGISGKSSGGDWSELAVGIPTLGLVATF
ncbi:MAG TPA: hypothetical protein VFQ61_20435 [Polyangiaceae bacterium]|nr:hypothetical protein [Polyangiaceae bacterium]